MKTDYETFKEIFDLRSPFVPKRHGPNGYVIVPEYSPTYTSHPEGGSTIRIQSVNGYSGFFTDFVFDAKGTLISVDAWE